jgi:hypothetical protein
MGAGTGKVDYIVLKTVYQEPVWFNMTFGHALVGAVKEMFMATTGQGRLSNDEGHKLFEQLAVSLELAGRLRGKHRLVLVRCFKGGVQGGCYVFVGFTPRKVYGQGGGYLPVNNVLYFLHGRNGNGGGGVVHRAGKPGIKLSLGEKAGSGGFWRRGGFARFFVRNAGNGEDKARGAGLKRFRHLKVQMQPPVGGYGYGLL